MTALKKRILSGMFALTLGFAIASPGRALADDWHHWGHDEWREHHDGDRDDGRRWRHDHDGDRDDGWRWRHDHDGDRDDAWRGRDDWYRPLPRNGEGMISPRNPNLYWACNSEGHHCHWAPRF
jgi:hypothetical protein